MTTTKKASKGTKKTKSTKVKVKIKAKAAPTPTKKKTAKKPLKKTAKKPLKKTATTSVRSNKSTGTSRAISNANAARKPPGAKPRAPARPSGSVSNGARVGDRAPTFNLQDQEGRSLSSQSLAGKPYVIYFYPRDNTPGCTREACDFRDLEQQFRQHNLRVIGVSADSVKSHAGFVSKYSLPFTLLSDPTHELIEAYGAWVKKQNYGREYMGIMRSTFLVDKTGRIAAEWRNVRVNDHAQAVLAKATQ